MALYDLTADMHRLYDMAEDEYAETDDCDFTTAFLDTMEGLEGEFNDKAANIGRLIRSLEADAKAVKEESDRLNAKQKSITNRAKWLKQYLMQNMQAVGKKQSGDAVTAIKIANNGGVRPLVFDPDEAVPEEYIIHEDVTHNDTDRIRAELDAGKELPFVKYGDRGQHLNIR